LTQPALRLLPRSRCRRDQIVLAESIAARFAGLISNDIDDDPVGGVYDQQRLAEYSVLVRSYRRYLPADGCRQRV
jgi:hypothetical protein